MCAATAAELAKEIAAHDEDVIVWTGDQKAATTVREVEKAGRHFLRQDYPESVGALRRAVAVPEEPGRQRRWCGSLPWSS
jgi:hypothetical protein